jgi:hypothetical protein
MSCPADGPTKRRWPLTEGTGNSNVSMEHTCDLYALGKMCEQAGIPRGDELAARSSIMVKSLYSDNRYLIGTTNEDCKTPNILEYPVDCQTWKLLSGADNQVARDTSALAWAINGAAQAESPGISFAVVDAKAQCAQYETTGGTFAALNEFALQYKAQFPANAESLTKMKDAVKLMRGWIMEGTPVVAAVTPSADVSGFTGCKDTACCSCIGDGWDYNINVPHLAATVWTVFGLAGIGDPTGFNPMQARAHVPLSPDDNSNGTGTETGTCGDSCPAWKIACLVLGIICILAILVLITLAVISKPLKRRKPPVTPGMNIQRTST